MDRKHSTTANHQVTSSSGLDPVLKSNWFWLAVGVTILIVLSQCGGGSSSPGNSPAAPDVGDQVGAYVVCQQFVEDRLVAPATAEFGGPYSQVTKTLGGGRYEVDTYVDSQNGFGALVRSDFVCTVKHVAGDRYSLESLDISEWSIFEAIRGRMTKINSSQNANFRVWGGPIRSQRPGEQYDERNPDHWN
jgi:hypothetical protein